MNFSNLLETERLLLRQWRDSDNAPFCAMCADPKVMHFMGSVIKHQAASAKVTKWRAHIQQTGWGLWAIELKQKKEFVGFAGLQVPADGHPFLPCVELGWRLAAAHWGKGFATEAANVVLRVAFDVLHLPEVIATAAFDNSKSTAVMERTGMRGPETIFQLPNVPDANPLGRHVLYRLSREEWCSRNVLDRSG